MTKLFPYSSPEARTAAGEMLVRGQWSLTDPQGNPKPEGPPLDELLWDIGRALGRDQGDLRACHELIPEDIAPRTDATLGEKVRLSDRLKVLVNAYHKAMEDYLQPIDTVPEEAKEASTPLLLFCPDQAESKWVVGHFFGGDWIACIDWVFIKPTHWMPLHETLTPAQTQGGAPK